MTIKVADKSKVAYAYSVKTSYIIDIVNNKRVETIKTTLSRWK